MEQVSNSLSSVGNVFSIPIQGREKVIDKLIWLQKLRMFVFPFLLALLPLGLRFHYISWERLSLFLIGIGLFSMTFLFTRFVILKFKNIGTFILFLSLVLDLTTFSVFLLSSKGIENPFLYYFFIHGFLGGVLLEKEFSLSFELVVHLALFSIQCFSLSKFEFVWFDVAPLIFSQHLLCFFSWLVSFSLARHLNAGFMQMSNLKLANEKSDRLRALGALSSGFSHEFASPLNTLKLKLRKIERLNENQVIEDDLKVLGAAVDKCDDTLKKMNFGLLNSQNLEYQEICLKSLLDDLISIWKQDKESTKVKNLVKEDVKITLPTFNFTQIVLYLMDNSFEASKENCLVRISSLKEANGDLTLKFYDNGEGFSPLVLERLGEPFNTSKELGVGLGLFSADLFMISLGGSLRVFNEIDGACVELRFPHSILDAGAVGQGRKK